MLPKEANSDPFCEEYGYVLLAESPLSLLPGLRISRSTVYAPSREMRAKEEVLPYCYEMVVKKRRSTEGISLDLVCVFFGAG
jgi:hypothetical protein